MDVKPHQLTLKFTVAQPGPDKTVIPVKSPSRAHVKEGWGQDFQVTNSPND